LLKSQVLSSECLVFLFGISTPYISPATPVTLFPVEAGLSVHPVRKLGEFTVVRFHCTVKPIFFACPLFRNFCEPGKFAKITGLENLNTVAFQCSRKQNRQNYRVQNNYIDSNAKIKGGQN